MQGWEGGGHKGRTWGNTRSCASWSKAPSYTCFRTWWILQRQDLRCRHEVPQFPNTVVIFGHVTFPLSSLTTWVGLCPLPEASPPTKITSEFPPKPFTCFCVIPERGERPVSCIRRMLGMTGTKPHLRLDCRGNLGNNLHRDTRSLLNQRAPEKNAHRESMQSCLQDDYVFFVLFQMAFHSSWGKRADEAGSFQVI